MFQFRKSVSSKKVNQVTQPVIEGLESRQLLSGSVTLTASGILAVSGTRKADKISIMIDRRRPTNLDVSVNGSVKVVKASQVAGIVVASADGNDSIVEDGAISAPSTLLGGAGNDTIVSGGGNDVVDAGDGVDECSFHHNSGVAISTLPAAVQTGLTTLAQGATIGNVQQFQEHGQTFYGALVVINNANTRIVVDASGNPVTTGLDDNHGGRDHHNGTFASLVSVDTGANTITVMQRSEHSTATTQVLNLTGATTVTLDGVAASLASLPSGAWIHLDISPTNATTVTGIQAFGKRAEGAFVSADAGAKTITLMDHESNTNTGYNLADGYTVTANGAASSLANLTIGMEVRLKFTADNSKVISIFAGDNGGNGGEAGHGGGGHGGHGGEDF